MIGEGHAAMYGTTTNPCPSWCDEPAGHGYDAREGDSEIRHHSRDFGDVVVDWRPVVSVMFHATEDVRFGADGLAIELRAPAITIDGTGDDLTGPQARETAAKLLAAADLWDGVIRS